MNTARPFWKAGVSRIFVPVVLLAAMTVGLGIWFLTSRPRSSLPAGSEGQRAEADPSRSSSGMSAASRPKSSVTTNDDSRSGFNANPFAQMPVSPYARELVAALTKLEPATLSPEQAALWKKRFEALIEQGAAGVPAIREFLLQNVDYGYGPDNARLLGFLSARPVLLEALNRIATPEAIWVLDEVLRTTADPREIATVTRMLETHEPGKHAASALAAASEALKMAEVGNLGKRDVAPLFEVMQTYGNEGTAIELELAAKRWGYYAANALANLPRGVGVGSLIRLMELESETSSRTAALQALVQLAAGSQEARDFVRKQVQDDKIPPALWPYLTAPLQGERYFPMDAILTQYPDVSVSGNVQTTRAGDQNLYLLRPDEMWTQEGINRQMALIEELIAASRNTNAIGYLEKAKDSLSRRKARPAADVEAP